MQGKSVLITRLKDQSKEFSEVLEKKGFSVSHLPLIELNPLPISAELKHAFENLDQIDWIVFTSVNAVNYFFQAADQSGVKFYFYPDLKIATVGEKTKLQLEQLGYRTNFVPIKYTAEVLADNMDDVEGKNILIPRSAKASNHYLEVFKSRGANPMAVDLYENNPILHDSHFFNESLNQQFDYIAFASGSAVEAFDLNMKSNRAKLEDEKIICIGPSTAKVAIELGYKVKAIAEPHTLEAMANTILKLEKDVQTA